METMTPLFVDFLSLRQVAALLRSADDAAGHHVLWVGGWCGEVHLDCLPIGELSPAGWAERCVDGRPAVSDD